MKIMTQWNICRRDDVGQMVFLSFRLVFGLLVCWLCFLSKSRNMEPSHIEKRKKDVWVRIKRKWTNRETIYLLQRLRRVLDRSLRNSRIVNPRHNKRTVQNTSKKTRTEFNIRLGVYEYQMSWGKNSH